MWLIEPFIQCHFGCPATQHYSYLVFCNMFVSLLPWWRKKWRLWACEKVFLNQEIYFIIVFEVSRNSFKEQLWSNICESLSGNSLDFCRRCWFKSLLRRFHLIFRRVWDNPVFMDIRIRVNGTSHLISLLSRTLFDFTRQSWLRRFGDLWNNRVCKLIWRKKIVSTLSRYQGV